MNSPKILNVTVANNKTLIEWTMTNAAAGARTDLDSSQIYVEWSTNFVNLSVPVQVEGKLVSSFFSFCCKFIIRNIILSNILSYQVPKQFKIEKRAYRAR